MRKLVYESGWFRLANQSAKSRASIHDDEKARDLGFRRGFVPGTTISIAVLSSIVEHFGKAWFDGGWHDLKFIDPAYDDEDLQVRFEEDLPGPLSVGVVTRAGRLTCFGAAGLGLPEFPTPPLPATPDVFPSSLIGTWFPDYELVPAVRDSLSSVRAAGPAGGEVGGWCRNPKASPWGKAVVPPAGLLPATRWAQNQLTMDEARLPGMNGRMQIAYRMPVFADEPLISSTWLAGKGANGRTWSRTIGFKLRDEQGTERAYGMHTIRWWAPAKASRQGHDR